MRLNTEGMRHGGLRIRSILHFHVALTKRSSVVYTKTMLEVGLQQ